jgi:hypothetical protein
MACAVADILADSSASFSLDDDRETLAAEPGEVQSPPAGGEDGELPSEPQEPPPRTKRRRGVGGCAEAKASSQQVETAARAIGRALGEKKLHLLRFLCSRFGVARCKQLLATTREREKAGGVPTADGKSRRQPGGAFLTLFREAVGDAAYKQALKDLERQERGLPPPPA